MRSHFHDFNLCTTTSPKKRETKIAPYFGLSLDAKRKVNFVCPQHSCGGVEHEQSLLATRVFVCVPQC